MNKSNDSAPWDELTRQHKLSVDIIKSCKTELVSKGSAREACKKFIQQYFRTTRVYLEKLRCNTDMILSLDGLMQDLLKLTNGNNRKTSYAKLLKGIREKLTQLEAEREINLGQLGDQSGSFFSPTSIENSIIDTLSQILPSAALSYKQALSDLNSNERVSYRGTANELREAMRETLDHFAPDSEVIKSPGFKFENDKNTPTQKQKIRYLLKQRDITKNAWQAPTDAAELVEQLTASMARATYTRSSISSHMSAARNEILQMKMYVDSVLAEILIIHK